jgi:hypothetical protein
MVTIYMGNHDTVGNERGGTSFKSWGEEQIGILLDRNNIRYQYEYPVALVDREKLRLVYPDFRLPDQGMIIEYFGVNGNHTYDEQSRHKMDVYRREGIDGLFLNRDSLRGNWPTEILGQIESILEKRLQQFRNTYCR